jgi:hypothetical protein
MRQALICHLRSYGPLQRTESSISGGRRQTADFVRGSGHYETRDLQLALHSRPVPRTRGERAGQNIRTDAVTHAMNIPTLGNER